VKKSTVSTSATGFTLLLFSVDPVFVQQSVAAGVDGIIIDWEHVGKERRQANVDTQINRHSAQDIRNIRAVTDATIICRINGFGDQTPAEIEEAIEAGVSEVLLPMVRHPDEMEAALDLAAGRCGVGMMVETVEAIEKAEAFGKLPLTRAYLGMHDLSIERKSVNLFAAITDGIVEQIRPYFQMPFGFAGVTLPECGDPIPCRLLMCELARLNCQFTFLRRAFHADIMGRDLKLEVPRIDAAMTNAFNRSDQQISRDREELECAINQLTDLHRRRQCA
jgi:hypothetical protein